MSDQSQHSQRTDPRVQAALREYLERIDRGELVNREEFLSRHSEIADALRSFFAAEGPLRKMAATKISNESAATSTQSIAAQGHETVPPKVRPGASLSTSGSGLAEKFGRYQIIRSLGKGAMGTVYLAEDTQIERQVALKTPHFIEDPTGEQRERFFREARAAGNLRHPHICPIYDFGQIDGKHFITMAYIDGRPLSAYIQLDNQQPERQILLLVRKLALALQEAHDHGVVHRDLKPANIMVDKKGEPMIMDFGLAQQTRPNEDVRLTQTGNILGTPAFMSPEQVEGEPEKIGPPSDQYSLGVILYELLTAQLPFRGSVMAVMGQILTKEPPPPSQLRPDLDARIEAVCLKMMAKNPAERFRSLKAAADEISSILKSPAAKTVSKEQPASSPAPSPTADRTRADAGASQVLKSLKQKGVTESDLASLEELARKCYSRRDFEQVIQIIDRVPEKRRNAALQALLEKSRGKADEISFLICDIDEAVRLNDHQTALKKAEELLKLKPGHHRALKVQEEFAGYGKDRAARLGPLRQFTQPWNEGGWIPWSLLAFGFAVFGVMTAVVTIYLRSGNTVVKIEINDPSVEVTVKGSTAAIKSPGQEVSVEPGENELTVTYGKLTFTTKSFTLKKGEKKTIAISIVDSKVIAKLGDEILEERPLRPLPPIPAGGKATTTVVKTLPPASLMAPFDGKAAKNAQKQWATHLQIPVELTNSIGMKLALIPPGKFKMGSSDADAEASPEQRPLHQVSITRPFFLGAAEVTRGQFAAFVRATDYKTEAERNGKGGAAFVGRDWRWDTKYNWRNPGFDQDDSHPVVIVSWNDARAFCDWLSRKEQKTYRLPTEAEWEYACRAGTETQFYSGGANSDLPMIANFGHTNGHTSPVGSFRANSFSLFDMSGNVVEWCRDFYGGDYYSKSPSEDPVGPASSFGRVCRGGSWFNPPGACRSASRRALSADIRISDIGFRVALSIEGAPNASANTPTVKPNSPQLLVAPFDEATAKTGQETWGGHLKTPVELTNSIGMKLSLIPPGEFQMGSADTRLPPDTRPVHRVRITKPFYMGVYEVTQEEFKRVMGSNPSPDQSDPRLPVTQASWASALDFFRKLAEMPEEKQAGRVYRFPTEAEWEYACRAGTQTLFHFGDVITTKQANFDGAQPVLGLPPGPSLNRLAKVGSYAPNAFGLYDMHGNATEAVLDWYSPQYYAASPVDDPHGASSGELAIGRGGSYAASAVPSAYRMTGSRSEQYPDVGFRVVCDIAPSTVPGASTASAAAAAVATDGFVPLFNGKDLTGWTTNPVRPGNWRVEDGILKGSGGAAPNYLFTERRDFSDFHIRVEARINDGGNSGVLFRAPSDCSEKFPPGYEAQINSTHKDPNKTGSLYDTPGGAAVGIAQSPVGPDEWFEMEVLAIGNQITIKVNGNVTANYRDEQRHYTARRIALQQHNPQTVVEFRKIEIKELSPQSPTAARPAGDADRRAAESVLSLGGSVTIRVDGQEQAIESGKTVPAEAFRLVRIAFPENAQNTDGALKSLHELTDLEVLWLQYVPVTDSTLSRLSGLTKMRLLDIGGTHVTDAGLVHLEGLAKLDYLNLGETGVTDVGLQHVRNLRQLKVLGLNGNPITDSGLENLEGLTNLEHLWIERTRVRGSGLNHIRKLVRLQKIAMANTGVTDGDLVHLRELEALEALNMAGTSIVGPGLANLKPLTRLRELDLTKSRLTNEGLVHLKSLGQLKKVRLGGTGLTDAGLSNLDGMSNLRQLDLTDTKVTAAAVEKLQKPLPQCRITANPPGP